MRLVSTFLLIILPFYVKQTLFKSYKHPSIVIVFLFKEYNIRIMKKNTLYVFLVAIAILGMSSYAFAKDGDREDSSGSSIEVDDDSRSLSDDVSKSDDSNDESNSEDDKISVLQNEARAIIKSGDKNPSDAFKAFHEQVKQEKKKINDEIKKAREEFLNKLKEDKESDDDIFKAKREDLLKGILDNRDLFEKEIEARAEESKAKRDASKAELEKELEKIKDSSKKTRVENLVNSITEVNGNVTASSMKLLNNIEATLIRIESRTDKAQVNGVDVALVRKAISEAEASIALARTAIATQTAKVYTVPTINESTLKSTFKSIRDMFKSDLESMKTKIKNAHESVKKASESLKQIPQVDDLEVKPTVDTQAPTATTTN